MKELVINLVYDDVQKTLPNGKIFYPNREFWDMENFIKTYANPSAPTFEDIIKIDKFNLSEVDFISDKKLYYIVGNAGLSLVNLITDHLIINDRIIDLLVRKNNFYVIIFNHHESDTIDEFIILDEFLSKHNVPKNQIYLVNNNKKLNDWKIRYNSEINIHSTEYHIKTVSTTLLRLGGCDFTPHKNKIFMCFNRSLKLHRFCCLLYLKKNSLLDWTNWSLIVPGNNKINYKGFFSQSDINKLLDGDYNEEIEYFNDLKFKISDHENNLIQFDENHNLTNIHSVPNVGLVPEFPINYLQSYINIVTETSFLDYSDNIHITEKSFKPFFYFQIPIFLATHEHVKYMRKNYDFDFFDDIIDHSYDNEPDQKKRFNLVMNEISKLYSHKDQVIDFYVKNKKRFDHNIREMYNLSKSRKDYDFFINLTR